MNRRSFLSGAVGALAIASGCLSDGGTAPNAGQIAERSRTPQAGATPRLSMDNDAYSRGFTAGSPWTGRGFDAGRSGHSPSTAVPDGSVGAAWLRTPVEGQRTLRTTPPVTDTETVYVGSGVGGDADDTAGFVAAIAGETGERVWRTTVTDGSLDGVAYTDGSVVAVSTADDRESAALTALASEDGTEQWQVTLPETSVRGVGLTAEMAYVSSRETGVTAVALDGTHQWDRAPATGEEALSSGVCLADSTLFVGTDRGRVIALDSATGTEQWATRVVDGGHRPRIQSLPTVSDGTVYVTGTDYHLYAVDAADGTTLWGTRLLEQRYGNAIPSIAVVDETVYVNTIHGGLLALDRRDGTERWRAGKYGGRFPPAVGDDLIVAPAGTAVRAYSRAGDHQWTFEMPKFEARGMAAYVMDPHVALAHDRVYISLHDGRIFSLGAQ